MDLRVLYLVLTASMAMLEAGSDGGTSHFVCF